MPAYKAVIFDLDDTLVKTWVVKWQQHKFVAKKYFGVDLTDDALAEHWGKPFDAMVTELYKQNGTHEERRVHFSKHELDYPKQYQDDTLATLETLCRANLVMGIVTSMHKEGAFIDLNNLKMPTEYFAFIQGSDESEYHKPDPRVFDPAKKHLAEQDITDGIVYVGDALSDYQASRDAGLSFIGVTTGFVDEQTFRGAGAAHIISGLAELPKLVL